MGKGNIAIYKGPFLEDVLNKLGLSENRSIKIIAYDDFVAKILVDDIRTYKPIIAIEVMHPYGKCKNNDCIESLEFRSMSLKSKGPFRMIWPYDRLAAGCLSSTCTQWIYSAVILRADQ